MELATYDFQGYGIRTMIIDDEPWFVGKDVAEALGYKNTRDALRRHVHDDDKAGVVIHDGRQNREMQCVNESGMYALIFGSQLERAQEFKRWVTSEVLPSIRKHGLYAMDDLLDNPDMLIESLQRLKEERAQRLEAEQKVVELQPKATYYELVLQSSSLISVTTIAKDFGRSAQWLNQKLYELGVQYKQGGVWYLYQEYANRGYTQSHTYAINDTQTSMYTKWTQKGRLFIYELLKEEGILPTIELEEVLEK